jgi:hypothetical protein
MAIVDFPALSALLARDELRHGRLMALDVGTKTIGVATSDVLRSLATPLMTLKRGKLAGDLAALSELAVKHEIKALAIGLPLNMDRSEGPRCSRCASSPPTSPATAAGARRPAHRPAGRAAQHRRRHPRHDRGLRHEPRQARRARRCGGGGVDLEAHWPRLR